MVLHWIFLKFYINIKTTKILYPFKFEHKTKKGISINKINELIFTFIQNTIIGNSSIYKSFLESKNGTGHNRLCVNQTLFLVNVSKWDDRTP